METKQRLICLFSDISNGVDYTSKLDLSQNEMVLSQTDSSYMSQSNFGLSLSSFKDSSYEEGTLPCNEYSMMEPSTSKGTPNKRIAKQNSKEESVRGCKEYFWGPVPHQLFLEAFYTVGKTWKNLSEKLHERGFTDRDQLQCRTHG